MSKTCVVVADRARARFFVTAEAAERSVGGVATELRELEALADPEGELTGLQAFSSVRSGTNRSPHGAAFEYDDHRERHREEVERRFAKRVASATRQFLAREHASRLILAVEPHMLGLLRKELDAPGPGSEPRVEVATDLSWHSPRHILEALERCGALRT